MGGVPPPVGLAALEGDAILVWCGHKGWAERACSGPGPDTLASARSTSFLNMTSQGPRQTAWPGRSGV